MQHAFVIPAWGDSPYLGACLASLAAQVARSPVTLTTSKPSDPLRRIAAEHGVDLRVNPRQQGIAADWNFALEATAADLVTLAHQDDLYAPDYAEAMRAAFARRPDALIAFCACVAAAPDGRTVADANVRVKRWLCRRAFRGRDAIDAPSDKHRLLAWGNPICCPSVVINRRALPGFAFRAGMRSNLDWEAWADLADGAGAFLYVDRPLVAQRLHPGSESSATIAARQRVDEDLAMFRRFWPAPVARSIAWVYRLSYRAHPAA